MVQTYLSSAIDDHSRYLVHSRFYDNQEESIVEDTFRNVLLKAGACDAVYFDNGSQYVAKQLKFSLARLGITVRHAKVRSGKSKGKIEKFHQVADAFLREARIHKVKHWKSLTGTGKTTWRNTTISSRTRASGSIMRALACPSHRKGSPLSRSGTGTAGL